MQLLPIEKPASEEAMIGRQRQVEPEGYVRPANPGSAIHLFIESSDRPETLYAQRLLGSVVVSQWIQPSFNPRCLFSSWEVKRTPYPSRRTPATKSPLPEKDCRTRQNPHPLTNRHNTAEDAPHPRFLSCKSSTNDRLRRRRQADAVSNSGPWSER